MRKTKELKQTFALINRSLWVWTMNSRMSSEFPRLKCLIVLTFTLCIVHSINLKKKLHFIPSHSCCVAIDTSQFRSMEFIYPFRMHITNNSRVNKDTKRKTFKKNSYKRFDVYYIYQYYTYQWLNICHNINKWNEFFCGQQKAFYDKKIKVNLFLSFKSIVSFKHVI